MNTEEHCRNKKHAQRQKRYEVVKRTIVRENSKLAIQFMYLL